uniref:Uncharacterized protein n=1 Tax=Timema bartmani TaxID=61472 RepID=A0A7R9I6U3_9NEOP|nr:unnamed protein product [Timema bartmani]
MPQVQRYTKYMTTPTLTRMEWDSFAYETEPFHSGLVNFLDDFESNRPEHLALHPMSVPSTAKTNKYGYKRNGSLNQTSLYSIEFSQQNVEDAIEFEEENNQFPDRPLSPRPMTPRRVKRRSVISRGSTSRTSQHDKRGSGTYNNTMRHSHRSSYRRSNLQHQNPVTRLIEQQQNLDSSTTSNESANRLHYPGSSQADLITPTQQWKKSTGHTNPVYEQNSTQSLNDDDIYNNRPSSARSSYSNYHGTRPISGYRGPGNAYFMTSQATPQVPVSNAHKHNSHRNHAAFLCSGPPPYHVDGAAGNILGYLAAAATNILSSWYKRPESSVSKRFPRDIIATITLYKTNDWTPRQLLVTGCVCVTRALCGCRSQAWLLVAKCTHSLWLLQTPVAIAARSPSAHPTFYTRHAIINIIQHQRYGSPLNLASWVVAHFTSP